MAAELPETHVEALAREWEQENWILSPPPAYFVRSLRAAIDADRQEPSEPSEEEKIRDAMTEATEHPGRMVTR